MLGVATSVPNGYAHVGDLSHVSFDDIWMAMAPGVNLEVLAFRVAWIAACCAVEGVPGGEAPKKPQPAGVAGAHVACFRMAIAVPQFFALLPAYVLMPGVAARISAYQMRCHERDVARGQRDVAIAARMAEAGLRAAAVTARGHAELAAGMAADERDRRIAEVTGNKDAEIAILREDITTKMGMILRLDQEKEQLERAAHTQVSAIQALEDELYHLRVDCVIFEKTVVDLVGHLAPGDREHILNHQETATPGSSQKIRGALERAGKVDESAENMDGGDNDDTID